MVTGQSACRPARLVSLSLRQQFDNFRHFAIMLFFFSMHKVHKDFQVTGGLHAVRPARFAVCSPTIRQYPTLSDTFCKFSACAATERTVAKIGFVPSNSWRPARRTPLVNFFRCTMCTKCTVRLRHKLSAFSHQPSARRLASYRRLSAFIGGPYGFSQIVAPRKEVEDCSTKIFTVMAGCMPSRALSSPFVRQPDTFRQFFHCLAPLRELWLRSVEKALPPAPYRAAPRLPLWGVLQSAFS